MSNYSTLNYTKLNQSNPKSYTLHPTPYTLHPTPYTLQPELSQPREREKRERERERDIRNNTKLT